ncbi:sugar phosphate isomerase/epimerase [Paenibacillus doosanensis]|uniref:sugar phosphate isomerase/epimerase family protein n=1 Tax=Paenibacillus doosanensis TaxID=1229154 RepID=UPI0021804FE7|nr:sugar phosphate isomerase/epimerase [Paenibacillus doosanensis]MCS7463494.1 sugar phosphate isomerase/epimerase [Paenibacillus doosanensis]
MLGFSIQSPVFLGKASKDSPNDLIAHYDRVEQLLDALKAGGVRSVEVRILPRGADEWAYRDLIQLIWDTGLQLTVHGHVAGEHPGTSFAEIYPSMSYILKHFHKYQSGLTMALHAFDAKTGSEEELHRQTVALLGEWTALIDAESLPLRIGIENNRKKASKVDPGDSIGGVLRIVSEVNHPAVGVTWDMGHFYSNLLDAHQLKAPPEELLTDLPDAEFVARAVHTHIHGIGKTGTHNPLTERSSLPLEQYVSALRQAGYDGVYNLELTMNKFEQDRPLREQVLASVERLRNAVRTEATT